MLNEKHRKNFAIFAIGLFAIASQALIFREFLCSFESNDIAVGVFFSSWFFWIAIASGSVLAVRKLSEKISAKTHMVILLYVPAFIFQYVVMLNIRGIAGVEAYEIFPIWKLISWAVIAGAPVSFITGAVFPLACRWTAGTSKLPVAGTFIYESIGSFVGGAGVTLLLYAGMPVEYIAMLICLIVIVACGMFLRRTVAVLMLLSASGLVAVAVWWNVGTHIRIHKWSRLLPAESYRGAFATPQAEYLYGVYKGQWSILREGGAAESVPDSESALKIISIHLAQKPDSRKILVIGSGLNICREFLKFPQVSEVAWIHYDPDYILKANSSLPHGLRISDIRYRPISGDARKFLKENVKSYDIVIVNMPDATSSVVNRYFTIEFYDDVAGALVEKGILGTRVTAGENVIGPELALAGASVKNSLGYVFKYLVIVPGDSSWFIVSESPNVTGDPQILEKRLAGVKGIAKIFPPESLRSLYLPDRAQFALDRYASASDGAAGMINTDSMPLGFLYALLLSSRQSGMEITWICMKIISKGLAMLLVPLLVFICLSLLSAISESSRRAGDAGAGRIVFCAGFVSIGTVIVLMYLFQTLLGSLYVNAGLLSALFMLGLAAGGILMVQSSVQKRIPAGASLLMALTAHVLLLFAISCQEPEFWNFPWFVAAFLVTGICCGTYFPIAARILRESGKGEIESGGSVEMADHVGACVGAISCGVIIVPFYGTGGALIFFMMLLALNIPLSSVRILLGRSMCEYSAGALILRGCAYILFGIAIFLSFMEGVLFGMNSLIYMMTACSMLFVVLSFRKGRAGRILLFLTALALAISSAVELKSAFRKKEAQLSNINPLPILEQASASKSERKSAPEAESETAGTAQGVPRDADINKVKSMIKSGKLSDKEADFYDKMEGE